MPPLPASGPGGRLLVAGAADARSRARATLAGAGLREVDEVGTVADLMARADRYAAVVLSGPMEGTSLPEALALLQSRTPGLRVVVLTGSAGDPARAARLAGERARPPAPDAPAGPDRPTAAAPPAASLASLAGLSGLGRMPVRLVVIASSTGGPDALLRLLQGFGGPLPVPTLVAQHMPAGFTALLGTRLSSGTGLTVREAVDGEAAAAGQVLLAPGDQHLVVTGAGRVRLDSGPEVNGCRPSADVLLDSVVGLYGASALAVVLTGMGSDGANGCRALVAAGGEVLAQDEHSSVVWGMPGAVARLGLPSMQAPPEILGDAVRARVGRR